MDALSGTAVIHAARGEWLLSVSFQVLTLAQTTRLVPEKRNHPPHFLNPTPAIYADSSDAPQRKSLDEIDLDHSEDARRTACAAAMFWSTYDQCCA